MSLIRAEDSTEKQIFADFLNLKKHKADLSLNNNRIFLKFRNRGFNLPKLGIQNLCSQFGCVVEIHEPRKNQMSDNKTCAFIFVEFAEVSSAENAIRSINNDKSLGLTAAFADRKVNDQQRKAMINKMANANGPLKFEPRTSQYENYVSSEVSSKILPLPINSSMRNVFQDEVPTLSKQNNNIKYVSGRSVYKELKEIITNMQNHSTTSDGKLDSNNNIYVARNMDLERQNVLIGPCCLCEKITEKYCEVCSEFYCSRVCQKIDWATHKKNCRPMPKLINPLEHIKIEKSSSIFSATSCPKIINRFPAKILEKSKTFSKNEKCMLKIVNGSPPLPTNISQQRIFSPEQKIIVSSDIMTSLPTKNSKVFVTSVVNEKILYIRHADPKSNAKYQRILNEVAIFSVHAPTLNKCPVKGDCVLAAFNGEFLRAEVLLVEQDPEDFMEKTVLVAYTDYGNTNSVKLQDLRYIDKKLQRLTNHTFRVFLLGVKSDIINDDVKFYLNSLLDDVELNINEIHNKKDGIYVSLSVSKNHENINQKINKLAEVLEPTLTDMVYFYDDLLEEVPPSVQKLKMVITNTSSLRKNFCVSFIEHKNLHKQAQLEEALKSYGARIKPNEYCPGLDELCLAKSGEVWYRATLVEAMGDGNPLVMLIDSEEFIRISTKNLRKMPKHFLTPKLIHLYRIKGVDENSSKEKIKFVESFLEIHKVVNVQSIDHTDDLSCLVIDEIVNFHG